MPVKRIACFTVDLYNAVVKTFGLGGMYTYTISKLVITMGVVAVIINAGQLNTGIAYDFGIVFFGAQIKTIPP